MDLHCQRLVTDARNALGSGPNLSQQPKSGVSSASIQQWARKYALGGADSGASTTLMYSVRTTTSSDSSQLGSFTDTTQLSNQPLMHAHTSDSLLFTQGSYGAGQDPRGYVGAPYFFDAGRTVLDGTQSGDTSLSSEDAHVTQSQPPGTSASRQLTAELVPAPCTTLPNLPAGSYPAMNHSDIISYINSEPAQNVAAAGHSGPPTHVSPSTDIANKTSQAGIPEYEDTQTESEVDSYVTLRPSQSISQVNLALRIYDPMNGAQPFSTGRRGSPSPLDSFDQECRSWHDDWVDSRSISQDHAAEFSRRYPTPPVGSASTQAQQGTK